MDYNKYYVYKEMVTYDSGQSWEYTGNETPSGDPIGTYDTLEECETSTGHTPTGYDCKLYVEFYTDYHHTGTTSYTIPCNDSTTLTFDEVNSAMSDIASQYDNVIDATLVVVGDCVETINLRPTSLNNGYINLPTGELIISPTVTKILWMELERAYDDSFFRGGIGKLTLYNTIREIYNTFIIVNDELHIEKGFLDNNSFALRENAVRFVLNGGYPSRIYSPKLYLSEKMPRYMPFNGYSWSSWSGSTVIVPDDSVGYYAATNTYGYFHVSGQTGGGESYQGVVGAIGTTDEGDTVEYYLNKYGVLGGTIRSDIVRFNVVSPTKGIHNLKIGNNYALSSLTVANSVKVIDTLIVDGDPGEGTTVLGNVSFPDGLWWMWSVFDHNRVYMVDWKNILPLPSGLYLFAECFYNGYEPYPGVDYNIDTLVIPDNCVHAWGFPNKSWAQIDTIKIGNKLQIFENAKANHFIYGQNLKLTNCSASGETNVFPDSLEKFWAWPYGYVYNTDFSFGTGIKSVTFDAYFNNILYFKNPTPPSFKSATASPSNVTFYVPSGSAERYFEATHGKSESFNPTIIEY